MISIQKGDRRMKRLWSPWRLEYLQAPAQHGCIFCHALRSTADRDNLVLFRGESVFLILNRYPYNNGHLMVVPNLHVPSLEDLDAPTLAEMMLSVNRGLAALRLAMAPDGFNVGINLGRVAGAGIEDHVHIHVVPRWLGDTNFMPVVGDMRVVPQTWTQTYDQVKAALDSAGEAEARGDSDP
jgi:ATP adenylyltransferase